MLIEDPAYPLLPGLLKEYDHCPSDPEVLLKTKLRSVRNQIECAFDRIKVRWRILNRPIDFGIAFLPIIIYSCFILHNYCETVKAPVNRDAIQKECGNATAKQSCSHHLEKHRLYSYNYSKGRLVRERASRNILKTLHSNTILHNSRD